jgi:hypothetical protein
MEENLYLLYLLLSCFFCLPVIFFFPTPGKILVALGGLLLFAAFATPSDPRLPSFMPLLLRTAPFALGLIALFLGVVNILEKSAKAKIDAQMKIEGGRTLAERNAWMESSHMHLQWSCKSIPSKNSNEDREATNETIVKCFKLKNNIGVLFDQSHLLPNPFQNPDITLLQSLADGRLKSEV